MNLFFQNYVDILGMGIARDTPLLSVGTFHFILGFA